MMMVGELAERPVHDRGLFQLKAEAWPCHRAACCRLSRYFLPWPRASAESRFRVASSLREQRHGC